MKELLLEIEAYLKDHADLSYLKKQVSIAPDGKLSVGYSGGQAIVLSPGPSDPVNYPVTLYGHTRHSVIIFCYAEYFGERKGLVGDGNFKGTLDMEQDVLDILVPDGNADFYAFDGLVYSCFWKGTIRPDSRRRNYDALNESRLTFEYQL